VAIVCVSCTFVNICNRKKRHCQFWKIPQMHSVGWRSCVEFEKSELITSTCTIFTIPSKSIPTFTCKWSICVCTISIVVAIVCVSCTFVNICNRKNRHCQIWKISQWIRCGTNGRRILKEWIEKKEKIETWPSGWHIKIKYCMGLFTTLVIICSGNKFMFTTYTIYTIPPKPLLHAHVNDPFVFVQLALYIYT
jgi:hypothetical protein